MSAHRLPRDRHPTFLSVLATRALSTRDTTAASLVGGGFSHGAAGVSILRLIQLKAAPTQ